MYRYTMSKQTYDAGAYPGAVVLHSHLPQPGLVAGPHTRFPSQLNCTPFRH